MSGDTVANSDAEQDEARRVVAKIMAELDATRLAYGLAFEELKAAGRLSTATRASVIQAIASVATLLRRLAPALATTRILSEDEQPDVALVLLRILTDSLSVSLAERPEIELMVAPDDVEALLPEVVTSNPASGADG